MTLTFAELVANEVRANCSKSHSGSGLGNPTVLDLLIPAAVGLKELYGRTYTLEPDNVFRLAVGHSSVLSE